MAVAAAIGGRAGLNIEHARVRGQWCPPRPRLLGADAIGGCLMALDTGQVDIDGDLTIGADTDFRFADSGIGMWAGTEVVVHDVKRSNRDGYLAGRDSAGAVHLDVEGDDPRRFRGRPRCSDRRVEVRGRLRGDGSSAACCRFLNLLGQMRVRFGRFRIPGEVLPPDEWAFGQVSGSDCDRLRAVGSAQFQSIDGITYSDVVHSGSTTRTLPGSGFTVPFTVPFTLGGSTGGALLVTNAGNSPVPWTATLVGPLTYSVRLAPGIGPVSVARLLGGRRHRPLGCRHACPRLRYAFGPAERRRPSFATHDRLAVVGRRGGRQHLFMLKPLPLAAVR